MEEPLSVEEVRVYGQRLRNLLGSLSETVREIEEEALEPSGGSRFQPDDEAIEETLLDADLDALAAEDELGNEVREALERIADDTFGVCETCGEWISRQRLALLPYARRCASCVRGKQAVRPSGNDTNGELCA